VCYTSDMENNPNNPEFMDDINADDLFIEADLRDDPDFDCEDDSWSDADSLASAGWGTDEDYGCPF